MPTNKPSAAAKPAKSAKSAKPAKTAKSTATAAADRKPAAEAVPPRAAMDPASRVAELGELLKKYKDAYYNGRPLVSDAAYDQLEDELRTLDPNHALLVSVGAPVPAKARPRAVGA